VDKLKFANPFLAKVLRPLEGEDLRRHDTDVRCGSILLQKSVASFFGQ
jgi:hypothetical protein